MITCEGNPPIMDLGAPVIGVVFVLGPATSLEIAFTARGREKTSFLALAEEPCV